MRSSACQLLEIVMEHFQRHLFHTSLSTSGPGQDQAASKIFVEIISLVYGLNVCNECLQYSYVKIANIQIIIIYVEIVYPTTFYQVGCRLGSRSMLSIARSIVVADNVTGLWRGLWPSVCRLSLHV